MRRAREVASGNRGQTELALTAHVGAVVHLVLVLLRGGAIQTLREREERPLVCALRIH